jgi:predicted GNAT family acetyltransferase
MAGGCCFEYHINSNSMLLSYFCVDPRLRGKGLARRLADVAERTADNDARRFRRLPRCDAFYLETNKLSVAVNHRDVMNPRTRHRILYNIGFRALNFRFVQPPLSPHSRPFDGLWLCVRLSSPHIVTQRQKEQLEREMMTTASTVTMWDAPTNPTTINHDHTTVINNNSPSNFTNSGSSNSGGIVAKRHYIPSIFVKNFIIDYWMSCVGTWKTDVHISTDKELYEMVNELNTKLFVELLELPWDATNPSVAAAKTDNPIPTTLLKPLQPLLPSLPAPPPPPPHPPPPPPPRLVAKL